MNPTRPDLITIDDWRDAYRSGASVEVLIAGHAARLAKESPREAWILRTPPEALRARLAELAALRERFADVDSLLAAHPLFGVPFAVKDNIDIEGLPTTAACPAFERVAQRSATAVRRLLDAGAVPLGKTNLDQFATGLVGTRTPYGAPSSVFAQDRISGGSSSGSAVVVARGDIPFSLGTDTAGSGRIPAGFNNLVGLKPTPGRVSTAGVVPACRSLDCVSIFALTVEDAATVLSIVEGDDPADEYGSFRPGPAALPDAVRVGIPIDPALGGTPGYARAWRTACERAAALGMTAVPVDCAALHEAARLLYEGPWVAERHAVVQPLLESNPRAMDPTVARVIGRARTFSATDAFRGQYALRGLRRRIEPIWKTVDLLMVPTAPSHPSHADLQADPIGANAALGTWTNFVNLLGWSALALPAAFTAQGLPFGTTFIGPPGADAALARLGQRWQRAADLPLGGTGRRYAAPCPPARWPATEATMPVAVVGAHLAGLPLNGQLTERGARLAEVTFTAPRYRLYALPGTTPPKPGMLRVPQDGSAIAVEVWQMPVAMLGSFLALVPPPLGLGSVELSDGRWVHGFLCEPHALEGARDISGFGGWRAYLASLEQ
jgi:allophanate hydrolase